MKYLKNCDAGDDQDNMMMKISRYLEIMLKNDYADNYQENMKPSLLENQVQVILWDIWETLRKNQIKVFLFKNEDTDRVIWEDQQRMASLGEPTGQPHKTPEEELSVKI